MWAVRETHASFLRAHLHLNAFNKQFNYFSIFSKYTLKRFGRLLLTGRANALTPIYYLYELSDLIAAKQHFEFNLRGFSAESHCQELYIFFKNRPTDLCDLKKSEKKNFLRACSKL